MDKEDHISQNPFQPYRPVYRLDLNKDTFCQWLFNFHMLFLFFTTGGSRDVMFSEDNSTGLHFPQFHSFQNFLIDDRMSVFKTDSQLENTSFPSIRHSKQSRRLHPIKTAVWSRFSSSLVTRWWKRLGLAHGVCVCVRDVIRHRVVYQLFSRIAPPPIPNS